MKLSANSLRRQALAKARSLAKSLIPARLMVQRGQSRRGRRVALTFDDGPDAYTQRYLDLLDQLQVRATFYLIGEAMQRHPDLVAAYRDRGHQLGFHGHTHRHFTRLPPRTLWQELQQAPPLLGKEGDRVAPAHLLLGRPMVRPPYGDIDVARTALCHAAGFVPVMWSLDTLDWKIHDAAQLTQQVADSPIDGGEILLLHEGQQWTLDALPAIVKDLRDRGFELVTVSELFS